MHQTVPFRLVIVEDHAAMREGMELLLANEGFETVGRAAEASEGYDLILELKPDVAIVDLHLPGESGADLARRLLRANSDLGILMYSGSEEGGTLGEALDCGARGFALKAGSPAELGEAIRKVATGGTYIDPRLAAIVLARETTEHVHALSPREREVLDLLAKGLTGEEVAKELFLSPETVRTHVRNAMQKLEAHTRAHAIVIALREHQIDA